MNQAQLVAYYQNNLEKVKMMHNPQNAVGCLAKERCQDYINFAQGQLDAVINGGIEALNKFLGN